jgi:hypothetical protein
MVSPPSTQSIVDDFEATKCKEAYTQTMDDMEPKPRFQLIADILENKYKKYSNSLVETTSQYLSDKINHLQPQGIRQFMGMDG